MGAFRCRVAKMANASVPPPPLASERHAVGVFLEGAETVNFTGRLAAFHVAGKRDRWTNPKILSARHEPARLLAYSCPNEARLSRRLFRVNGRADERSSSGAP